MLLGSLYFTFSVGFSCLPLARGVGLETELALSSHHVLKHSGDSRKLATLSALELGLKGPRTAPEPIWKSWILHSPALCLNTTDPAASHSSLPGKNGGTVTFHILDETSTPKALK